MKIKAINLNHPRGVPRENKWYSAYHKCINSSRCNKLFGLIFLMSIGAIFTAVIVMAVIRADLFDTDEDNSNSTANTTREIFNNENSQHIAIDNLVESLNTTPGELDIFHPLLEPMEATTELLPDVTPISNDSVKQLVEINGDDPTTLSSTETTTFTTITSEPSTTEETSPPYIPEPPNVPGCYPREGDSCSIVCANVNVTNLRASLIQAVNISQSECDKYLLSLLLDNIQFPDTASTENWLDVGKISGVTFVNVTIIRSEFETLQKEAFIASFKEVNYISISDMEGQAYFSENSFVNLTKLNTLVFRNIRNFFPSPNGLGINSASLKTLECTGMVGNWTINRLTGSNNYYENIETLELSNNNFVYRWSTFSTSAICPSLKYIYLANSGIKELNSNTFENCTNLEAISLANNNISSIPPKFFDGLINLSMILLQNNQLKNLPDGLLPTLTIQRFNITSNLWECDLEILYLKKVIEANGISSIACEGPPELNGVKISELWCSRCDRCKISCSGIDEDILRKNLEIYDMTSCSDVYVDLNNQTFGDSQVPSYWLSNLTYNISILHLESTLVRSFEPHAFDSSTFHALKELKIDTPGGTSENELKIKNTSFIGLNEIETLKIIKVPRIHVDEKQSQVFEPISPTLVELTIAESNLAFLRRLFENVTFQRLEILNLNGNNFGGIVTDTTFTGVHGCLKKLNMRSSQISSINNGSFNKFQQLEVLDLRNNILLSLPVGIFDVFKTNQNFVVYLENNVWDCSSDICHLAPFANENVICSNSSKLIDVCESYEEDTTTTDTSTSTTTSTTSTTSSTTTSTTSTSTSTFTTTDSTTSTTLDTTTSETSTTTTPEPTTTTSTSITTEGISTSDDTEPPQNTTIPTTITTTDVPTTTTSSTTTSSTSEPATTISESTTSTSYSSSSSSSTSSSTSTSTSTEVTTPTTENPDTTSPPETTLSLHSSSTFLPGDGNIQIPCIDGTLNITSILFNSSALTLPSRDSITVYRPPVLFTIHKSGPNEVTVIFDAHADDLFLLYYPVHYNPFDTIADDPNDPKCIFMTEESVVIDDLRPNTVYTFCSLFNVIIFTPFQCVSFANVEGMPWLYEEQKAVIITSLTLIFLLVLVAGILMTYFLIRRMPTLIRGSKRVVIVNNRSKEVMILPRSADSSRSNSYRKESVVTPIVPEPPTYLTPLPRQSIDHRPPFVRSNSDTSLKSYVSVSRLPPRFSQVYQLGDFDNCSSRHRNGSYPRQIPSAPYQQSPELPPPLPRRSVVSTASSAHHSIASTVEIGKISRSSNHHNSTFRRHRPSRCDVEEENHYNIII